MTILIFGIPCIGKTVTGERLAQILGYKFIDHDLEIRKTFNTTQQGFMDAHPWPDGRGKVKGEILTRIIEENRNENTVIAVGVMWYSKYFVKHLKNPDIFAVELLDSPENLFDRVIYTDDDTDEILPQEEIDELKERYSKSIMKEIRSDISHVKRTHARITNKYNMDGRSIDEVSEGIAELFRAHMKEQAETKEEAKEETKEEAKEKTREKTEEKAKGKTKGKRLKA